MNAEALRFEGLIKSYEGGNFQLELEDLSVAAGEHLVVLGPSGSGKTTLLDLVAGVQLPDQGRVLVQGELDLAQKTEGERRMWRQRHVGWVFQELELIEYLDGLQNVLLPSRLGGGGARCVDRARTLLERTGTTHLAKRKPAEMSQGERQRLAICRALLLEPAFLLCDEPTGNLDRQTADQVLDLILGCARESGATLLLVTHDASIVDRFDRELRL